MSYVVRPISDRTPFTGRHQRSMFSANWSSTESLLLREVIQLRGQRLVIEADVTEMDIRLDGQLRANARPSTPAIRVAFESKHGPLVYATDRFYFWQDNVRAIALGLEALRKVDRYGITQHGEQYTGWKAIEATPASMSRDAALKILRVYARMNGEPGALNDLPRLFKLARRNTHPDAGGERGQWDQVEQAGRVLGVAS